MDLQKERISTFFTAFEHRKKKLAACSLLHIDIPFASECLCHLRAQYLIQSPNICSKKQIFLSVHAVSATGWLCFCTLSHKHHTNRFAALKMISCNPAPAWHTSSILCNPRTLGQNTQMSSTNVIWVYKISPNVIPSFNVAWFKR